MKEQFLKNLRLSSTNEQRLRIINKIIEEYLKEGWREAELIMDGFEYMSNADKGITLINKEGYRVACAGEQSKKVIAILEKEGKVKVKIQYLQKTNEGKFRFISYRGLA